MFTVKDFFPLWSFMKSGFLFHFAGSSPRWPSPRNRVSQRITSAPNSQSTRATVGPAAPVVSSTTRIPSKGSVAIEFFQRFYYAGREGNEGLGYLSVCVRTFVAYRRDH